MGRNNNDFHASRTAASPLLPDKHGRLMSKKDYNSRSESQIKNPAGLSSRIDPEAFCDTSDCKNPATKFSWDNGLGCEDHPV
jgi:hypothetical protein